MSPTYNCSVVARKANFSCSRILNFSLADYNLHRTIPNGDLYEEKIKQLNKLIHSILSEPFVTAKTHSISIVCNLSVNDSISLKFTAKSRIAIQTFLKGKQTKIGNSKKKKCH
jgi:hypothetical protein